MSKVMERTRKVERKIVRPDKTNNRKVSILMWVARCLACNPLDKDQEAHFPKAIRKSAGTFRYMGNIPSARTQVISNIRTLYLNTPMIPVPNIGDLPNESDLFESVNVTGVEEFIAEYGVFYFDYDGKRYAIVGKKLDEVFEAEAFILPNNIVIAPIWSRLPDATILFNSEWYESGEVENLEIIGFEVCRDEDAKSCWTLIALEAE